jgi:two-component system, chemotaxis family, CheB/CheR fusion protein
LLKRPATNLRSVPGFAQTDPVPTLRTPIECVFASLVWQWSGRPLLSLPDSGCRMDDSQSPRAEDHWASTFDAVPDLILILDNQHRVVRANKAMAERIGCAPRELVGKPCFEALHNAPAPPLFCPHSRLLASGEEQAVEIDDERLGGTFLVTVSPIRGPRGTLLGSVHVARDISAQKRAECQAVEAVRQRDQFLAMLSHELRNPLGAILNAAGVLEQLPPPGGPFADALAVIGRQARQMSRLLDDLLDVARVMQGKISLARQDVDLVATVHEAVAAVRGQLDARTQALTLELPDQPLCVCGDPARLQQIPVNLLMNAAKFTPPGGHITLRLCREDHEAVLIVRDDGQGIPGDMLESIFELFAQADTTLHREQGGLGIGLTLVRMLAEMHGGRVTAASAGPGQGSEFLVRLPLPATAPHEPVPSPVTAASPRLVSKVLIVEDNADVRSTLHALLEFEGHDVQEAADGDQGLQILTREPFDVALVDIGLPGMDGYELARRARLSCGQDCPRLVALTGYGRASDRAAVQAAGFDEHLVKPCDPDDLFRVLAKPR